MLKHLLEDTELEILEFHDCHIEDQLSYDLFNSMKYSLCLRKIDLSKNILHNEG